MADDITDTVSTVPKMPEIPPRKSDSNPFSLFCGASINGGVFNLNIYSGKRKRFNISESDSSQE